MSIRKSYISLLLTALIMSPLYQAKDEVGQHRWREARDQKSSASIIIRMLPSPQRQFEDKDLTSLRERDRDRERDREGETERET
jgi:hypothetical protein